MTTWSGSDRSEHRGATSVLCAFATELRFDELPDAVVSVAKRTLLDTIAVSLAGAATAGPATVLADGAVAEGGTPESTVLGHDQRIPAARAAFANGALAHAADFDDVFEPGSVHVGVTVIPAALAAAERSPDRVSGQALIEAVAAGAEVVCQLARTIAPMQGDAPRMLLTQVFGYFGAAVAAGRLMGLNASSMRSAIGLALMQAAGTMEIVHAPAHVGKSIYGAFCAQGGTQSAMLASQGLAVDAEAFEGRAGLLCAVFDSPASGGLLFDELGERFAAANVAFKPWPGTRYGHVFVDAALELARTHDLAAEEIRSVELEIGPRTEAFCVQAAERARPATSEAAHNSVPFAVAKALTRRSLTVEDFIDEALGDESTLRLAAAVAYRVEPGFAATNGAEPGTLRVRLTDGRAHERTVAVAPGAPTRPLRFEDIASKASSCGAHAGVPENRVQELIERIRRLEDDEDARDMLAGLAS